MRLGKSAKISSVRRYGLINVYAYDFETLIRTGSAGPGLEQSFKNVRYSKINDEKNVKARLTCLFPKQQ